MRGFVGWTRRGFARQIRRWTTPPLSNRTSLRSGGFANKSGLCRVSEVANLQLWVTRRFPKPSPKRDRVITKATAVSPLSPHRSEEHTSELQSRGHLVCRVLLEN